MKVIVIGGGHIGTLAGWLMPHATVLDWRKPSHDVERHRPRPYGAMYLHKALEGIPCRPLDVRTTIDGKPATEESAWAYKRKVGKESDMDCAGLWRGQFKEFTVGWEMVEHPRIEIRWGSIVDHIDVHQQILTLTDGSWFAWDRIISTIPFYSLLDLMRIPQPSLLEHRPIAVRSAPIPLDVPPMTTDIHVNYVSDPSVNVYRTTDRHGNRDNEWLYDTHARTPIPGKILRPGKVYRAPWTRDMCSQLNVLGVYPVGRAGRWEPDELTHDSYNDLLVWVRDMRA